MRFDGFGGFDVGLFTLEPSQSIKIAYHEYRIEEFFVRLGSFSSLFKAKTRDVVLNNEFHIAVGARGLQPMTTPHHRSLMAG